MLKLNLKNSSFVCVPNTQNRPYLLNEQINTNIQDSVKKQDVDIKFDGKNWARTILSNENAHNKIAVMWARGILKNG